MDDIDTDMEFPQHLGMNNDALDINDIDFMDENILKSKPQISSIFLFSQLTKTPLFSRHTAGQSPRLWVGAVPAVPPLLPLPRHERQ